MKRQSQSLKSAIAKFEECARTGLVMSLRKPEVIAFIRYAREVEYDLETGMVNLMAQNYGADNCEENHDATGGVCKCWTGMTMDDFSGENPKDVDIAEWWGPFQFWKNSETVMLYSPGEFCEDIQDLQTCADRGSNAPCSPCMRRIDNISVEAGDSPDRDESIDGNQCPGCGNRTTACVCRIPEDVRDGAIALGGILTPEEMAITREALHEFALTLFGQQDRRMSLANKLLDKFGGPLE